MLVVLAYRGLSFWLPTLIGFALAALLQRTRGRSLYREDRDPSPVGSG